MSRSPPGPAALAYRRDAVLGVAATVNERADTVADREARGREG